MRMRSTTLLIVLFIIGLAVDSHAQGREPAGERGGRDHADRPDRERPDSGGRDRPDRAEAGTTSSAPSFDRIQLSNPCGAAIDAAISYQQPNKEWIVSGWWTIPPGGTSLTNAASVGRTVYIYARDTGGREWNGKSRAGSIDLAVVFGSAFSGSSSSLASKSGARVVSFFAWDTGTAYGTQTVAFGC